MRPALEPARRRPQRLHKYFDSLLEMTRRTVCGSSNNPNDL
jgi:hypothetical protein